jgi:hypothetical protein
MKHGPKIPRERKNNWPLAVPGALLLSVQFAAASAVQQGDALPLGAGGSAASGGGSASGGRAQLDWGCEEAGSEEARSEEAGCEELGSGGQGTGGSNSGGSGGVVIAR